MRLAAITGMDNNLDKYSDSQQIKHMNNLTRPKYSDQFEAATNSGRLRAETAAANIGASAGTLDRSLRNIWIGSAILLIGTLLILIYA
jgi:hypothetical protein